MAADGQKVTTILDGGKWDGTISLTLTLSRSRERGQPRTIRFGLSGMVMQSATSRKGLEESDKGIRRCTGSRQEFNRWTRTLTLSRRKWDSVRSLSRNFTASWIRSAADCRIVFQTVRSGLAIITVSEGD